MLSESADDAGPPQAPALSIPPRLIGAALGEHRRRGLEEDRDVEPDRPVLEVVEVEPHEIVEREVAAAGDLPQAGHAREHVVAAAVPRLEALVVADGERTRADE